MHSSVGSLSRWYAPGDSGDAWAAIVFDENFTADVLRSIEEIGSVPTGAPGAITIHIDASNSNIAQAITNEVRLTVQTVIASEYHVLPPITVSEERVYGEGSEFIDFFAPGVMGLAAMMVTFMLSIISFVHERTTGTLDRLLTTPATEGEIVAGYALALLFNRSGDQADVVAHLNAPLLGKAAPALLLDAFFKQPIDRDGMNL